MNPAAPSWSNKCWCWLRAYPYSVAGAVAALALAAVVFGRQHSEWQEVYLTAAAHLGKGEDIYRPEEGYLYPPFMAWTALPFLALPAFLARLVWLAINLICLIALLRWSWRLARGGALEGVWAKPRERVAALLGGSCGVFYLQNCLVHQQTDVLISAALAGGCLLWVRGRPFLAAASLGLAAACKCTGLLFAPYLLWRGRPLAAAWLLVVALGVNLLPDLLSSTAPNGRPWLAEYASRYLLPITDANHIIGSWGSYPVYNQSLSGAGKRWCATTWTWRSDDCTIETRPPLLDSQVLRAWVYGLQLALLSAVLWTCGRPFRTIAEDSGGQRQALECSVVLLLMLLLSPMSSKAHFGTLMIPGFIWARAALASRRRASWGVVLGAVVLGVLSNKDPLGERLYTLSLWYGVVTWQTLLLLAGCLIALRRLAAVARTPLPCPAPLGAAAQQAVRAISTPFSVRKDACRASA